MSNPTITTNYAGSDIGKILQNVLLGNEAIEKGQFYIWENVQKLKELTRGFVASNPLQEFQSMPTVPSNSLSFSPRTLVPTKMTLFDLVNPLDFQSYWEEYQPEGPLADKVINSDIIRVIMDLYKKQLNLQIGRLMWGGDVTLSTSSPLRFLNGIITKAVADANVQKPSAVGAITAGNIQSILTSVDALILDAVYEDPTMTFHMSTAMARLYMDSLIGLTYKDKGPADFNKKVEDLTFKNRKIVTYTTFPNNYILAAKGDTNPINTHLHMGVNLQSDFTDLKMERWRPEGDQWFIKGNIMMDVNYSFSEEIVLYKPS